MSDITSAKFLFTDINPDTVVPVSVPVLEETTSPPELLRDPTVDFPGSWQYVGTDGDHYVYRELLEDTSTSSAQPDPGDALPATEPLVEPVAGTDGVVTRDTVD